MTLEEAQAQIVELTEQVTELTNERDTLSQNNETLKTDLERVRTLNQKYFEKLSMQTIKAEEKPEEPEEVKSCEEFAKGLNI